MIVHIFRKIKLIAKTTPNQNFLLIFILEIVTEETLFSTKLCYVMLSLICINNLLYLILSRLIKKVLFDIFISVE